MPTFFELEDDLYFKGRWHINELRDRAGIELDSREFNYGKPVDLGPPIMAKTWKEGIPMGAQPPLKILLEPDYKGVPLDFTFTSQNTPVAKLKVANLLDVIAFRDIQRVPVLIESQKEDYEIINVTSVIDCIDTKQSEIDWYEEGNEIRPDKVGEPFCVYKLVVDPTRIGEHHIFRVKGWKVVIVVSDTVKNAFEEMKVSGVYFRQVSD